MSKSMSKIYSAAALAFAQIADPSPAAKRLWYIVESRCSAKNPTEAGINQAKEASKALCKLAKEVSAAPAVVVAEEIGFTAEGSLLN